LVVCVPLCFVLRSWVRLLLKPLDINVSHSCACMCIVMAIVCAWVGIVLYVGVSGGFSLKDIRCAIFASQGACVEVAFSAYHYRYGMYLESSFITSNDGFF
jgi:hypothetical protein